MDKYSIIWIAGLVIFAAAFVVFAFICRSFGVVFAAAAGVALSWFVSEDAKAIYKNDK